MIKKMMSFIDASPTAFHAIENVAKMLDDNDYARFDEKNAWKLSKTRRGYVVRNSSSLIAFAIPTGKILGFRVFAAHSDSPAYRIKENAEVPFGDRYVRLNTERYGGMIQNSWLDRPLSIAGRVIYEDSEGGLAEALINIDKDLCVIPNVAVHMNPDVNKGYEYKAQNDMLPLLCEGKPGCFDDMIAKATKVSKDKILGRDLFVYARQKGTLIGPKKEFVLSPRLDDLACVYAGATAFIDSEYGNYIQVLAVFDNEEVGSLTKQGADSTFLEDVLYRIAEDLSYSRTDYLRLLADSFIISADNAHGIHPAMPGKADLTNRPYLNGGVVLKFNGNQRYATDAYSAAFMRQLAKKCAVDLQDYANNSDIPGGSTLGNISTGHVSVPTADIGLAQLSMHSAVETMGAGDEAKLVRLAKAFYEQ